MGLSNQAFLLKSSLGNMILAGLSTMKKYGDPDFKIGMLTNDPRTNTGRYLVTFKIEEITEEQDAMLRSSGAAKH